MISVNTHARLRELLFVVGKKDEEDGGPSTSKQRAPLDPVTARNSLVQILIRFSDLCFASYRHFLSFLLFF